MFRKRRRITPVKKITKDVTDDYIKGADKFPIQQKRMGFLPLVIQRFLKTDNQKCQVSANKYIFKTRSCLFIKTRCRIK